jgi:alkylhydroperoxidase/carboxymuconolactone decarboxylase family protein YurZ
MVEKRMKTTKMKAVPKDTKMQDLERRLGSPSLFKELMKTEPDMHDMVLKFDQHIWDDGALSKQTKKIIAISIAAALRDQHAVRAQLAGAPKLGIKKEEIEEAKDERIKILFLLAPTRIVTANGSVTGLECLRMELGDYDESNRRRPMPIKGSEFVLDVDTVICPVDRQGLCKLPDPALVSQVEQELGPALKDAVQIKGKLASEAAVKKLLKDKLISEDEAAAPTTRSRSSPTPRCSASTRPPRPKRRNLIFCLLRPPVYACAVRLISKAHWGWWCLRLPAG